jgi:hypothetical protein
VVCVTEGLGNLADASHALAKADDDAPLLRIDDGEEASVQHAVLHFGVSVVERQGIFNLDPG